MTRLSVVTEGRPRPVPELDGLGSRQRSHRGGLVDGMARILHPDGGELILPAYTDYDVELLVEYAEWCAHRYGKVCLELASRIWLIDALSGRTAACTGCHERRALLCFNGGVGELWLCTRCAQEELEGGRRRRP